MQLDVYFSAKFQIFWENFDVFHLKENFSTQQIGTNFVQTGIEKSVFISLKVNDDTECLHKNGNSRFTRCESTRVLLNIFSSHCKKVSQTCNIFSISIIYFKQSQTRFFLYSKAIQFCKQKIWHNFVDFSPRAGNQNTFAWTWTILVSVKLPTI